MQLLNQITSTILSVFAILVSFKIFYYIVGFLFKVTPPQEAKTKHKFAVVISARNEEKVIGNLIDSLNAQDYPKELLTIFVVADNCQDDTAKIARAHGAIVYERFNPEKARKGYALEFLFDRIKEDYGIESFEGYQIFDADNVVSPNYFTEVNKVFDNGADAIYGYLHSKNYDANFISAAYGMSFCRAVLGMHRPRTILGTTTHFSGTGILIKSCYLTDGWRFHELAEDTEACVDIILKGGKTVMCETAIFFDEQPVSFKYSFRQRLRWTKGRLVLFFKHGHKLLKGIFTSKPSQKFGCYDMYFVLFPYALCTLLISAIYPVTSTIISLIQGQPLPVLDWLVAAGTALATKYVSSVLEGALILIREQKHIYCSKKKQILYLLCWPWFDLVNLPLTIACLFMKITWKPIKHVDTANITQVQNKKL